MEEIKDIKIGETYNMRVKVISVDIDDKGTGVATIPVDGNGKELDDEWAYYGLDIASAFSPITPENGIKNTENAPKYDPCRLFRKGDKVRLVPFNGRAPIMYGSNVFGIEEVLTVEEDENKEYEALVKGTSARQIFPACFLELVTPVEELEPYRVETGGYNRFRIKKGNLEYSYFPFGEHCVLSMDEAKAAAEAECDRLNAEHRKEQNNG